MQTARAALSMAVLSLLPASAVAGQESTSEAARQLELGSGDSTLDAVTVTAKRRREILKQRISKFVSSVAIQSHTESLARWQVPICPLVAGASRGNGEYIQGRVSQIATDAAVPLAARDCRPNFVIVLTPEPERLLRNWWAQSPRLFNKERGLGGINHFIESEDAIRAWYNACSVSPGLAKTFVMKGGPNCNTGSIGSRLSWEAVRSIYSVIVVVNLARMKGLNVGQIADYVAMIGLAQIRRDSELSDLPTILNLFAETGGAKPQGLSSWDRSFLKSLYGTESGNITQVSQIKNGMQRDLSP